MLWTVDTWPTDLADRGGNLRQLGDPSKALLFRISKKIYLEHVRPPKATCDEHFQANCIRVCYNAGHSP